MTNEQWLLYLWSIYPNGLFIQTWIFLLVIYTLFITVLAAIHFDVSKKDSAWTKMGKWKIIIPSILAIFIFISYLVPKRDHFLLIIATPYAVEAGKTLTDSLNDPTSKMFKLNQLVDKGLEKMLQEMTEPKE